MTFLGQSGDKLFYFLGENLVVFLYIGISYTRHTLVLELWLSGLSGNFLIPQKVPSHLDPKY